MASVQQFNFSSRTGDGPNAGMIESVYAVIQNRSGSITSRDLDKIIGNKQDVRFAITRLTVQGRIKRVRGFGKTGIEYFYRDVLSSPIKPRQHSPIAGI